MNQRVGGLVHLPSRSPMDLDASSICFFRKPAEQVAETAVEQRFKISFRRAVSVELQEEIVADGGGQLEPLSYPRWSRHVVASEFSGFQARQQPFAEAQADWPGNHEQVAALPPPTVASIPRSKDLGRLPGLLVHQ